MENRKDDHISLSLAQFNEVQVNDKRFLYEPLLSGHPEDDIIPEFEIANRKMRYPIWISSLTGATKDAYKINSNLAQVANEFGLGFGLGSCRALLDSDKNFKDFDLRNIIGDDLPFFANIGIAQAEQLFIKNDLGAITDLVNALRVNGIIIHINPIQEWIQEEGDLLKYPPLMVIRELVHQLDIPIIVKEVGQGMGPESIKQLLRLPLEAIEFSAFGGTNFASIELSRRNKYEQDMLEPLSHVGETIDDMLKYCSSSITQLNNMPCDKLIISGGIKTYLDGYYAILKSPLPSVYGMGANFLRYATDDYRVLRDFAYQHIEGLKMAFAFLSLRNQ